MICNLRPIHFEPVGGPRWAPFRFASAGSAFESVNGFQFLHGTGPAMEGAVTITDLTWVKRGSGQLLAREAARNAAPFVQPGVNINIGFKTIENQFKIILLGSDSLELHWKLCHLNRDRGNSIENITV